MSWELFRRGKRKRIDVMIFERRLEDNLYELREDLLSGTYTHQQYQPFNINDPKRRIIHKANVRDRLVHQAVVSMIEPLFECRFIHDSFSCRRNKGTHAAVQRLRIFLRQASLNNTRTVYAVKCDVRKFFASVDHKILCDLLERRVKDELVGQLLRTIIASHEASPGKGIPLGNLTSQLFANIYLHELDRHMKHSLHIRHYIRYCDDFAMIAPSMKDAFDLAYKADAFLQKTLLLGLHPNKTHVRTWKQGVDFLGYVLLPHATVIRTVTARRMLRRAEEENLPSYLGICAHADGFEIANVLRNKVAILI